MTPGLGFGGGGFGITNAKIREQEVASVLVELRMGIFLLITQSTPVVPNWMKPDLNTA